MATFGRQRAEVFDRAARSQYYRDNVAGLTAFERHTKLIQDALNYNNSTGALADSPTAGADSATAATGAAAVLAGTRTDADVLQERYRFIRSAEDDVGDAWEVKLARKYYARLFKEYAIADLSRYKQGAIGLRWRTHAEVVSGKGQFICGGRGCEERQSLASFEVPFAYKEAGQAKQALVKLRLCPRCAGKLNYKHGSRAAATVKGDEERRDAKPSRGGAGAPGEKEGRKGSRGDRKESSKRAARSKRRHSSSASDPEEEEESMQGDGDVRGRRSSKRRRRGREPEEKEDEEAPSDDSREMQQRRKDCSRRHSSDSEGTQQQRRREQRGSKHSRRERSGGGEGAKGVPVQPQKAAAAEADEAGVTGPSTQNRHRLSRAAEGHKQQHNQQQQEGGKPQDGSAASMDADELEFERMLESMFAQV